MGDGSAASLKKALCVSKEGRLGCSDGTGVRPLLCRTRKVRRMLEIKHKGGLTKSDQMINIQLGQTLHLLKVSATSLATTPFASAGSSRIRYPRQ